MINRSNRQVSGKSCDKLLKGAGGELGYLIEQSTRLERLSRTVRDRLPAALGQHCRLANVTRQTLIMHADSPAWASKLRYYCPQLLAELCQIPDFGQLNDFRIKTVPPEHLQSPRQTAARHLPASAARLLRATAAVTPSSPLRDALLRLANREQR
jgi:hypothetical protein